MRRLIHIPVVHGSADMGSALSKVRQAHIDRRGRRTWQASRRAISDFWEAMEKAMDRIRLDYRNVRLYQDGLPVCGLEEKIVRDLAGQGVANYRILLKLMERGAKLEGTENPDLLRKEYELTMKSIASAGGRSDVGAPENGALAELKDLLDQRDHFIAQRIDSTLRQGETGILFIGALHNVADRLPATIEIVPLAQMR